MEQPTIERVVPGQETPPGINRLTGKPNAPASSPADVRTHQASATPGSGNPFEHFSNEYLMKAVQAMQNGVRLRLLVTGPDAEAELKRRGVNVGGFKTLDAPVDEEAVEEPLDEVAQLRASLGLGYFPEQLDECNMPGDMASPPKQSDSVSMNVSLNASGSGGIKDLMGILKGIEQGHSDPGHDAEQGKDVIIGGNDFPFDEEFANAPEEVYAPVDAVIPSGDDLHGQGGEAPKVNGGGNPMAMESLKLQLGRLYQEIKETETAKDQYGNQIKKGGYQDQAISQLRDFSQGFDKKAFIDQLKQSPEMLARMGLAVVGQPFGAIADYAVDNVNAKRQKPQIPARPAPVPLNIPGINKK